MRQRAASEGVLRGLVIDWGGVLTSGLDDAMTLWARQEGIDYEHFRAVLRSWVARAEPADGDQGCDQQGGPVADLEQTLDGGLAGTSPVHRLERGEISGAEFEHALAVELERRGSPVSASGLLNRMLAGLRSLDDEMVKVVARARARGIRTALLSNSWGDHYPARLWDGLFDVVVISGRVGMRKPEPRIFRHACDELGLAPSECVMVDDLPHNVSGALAIGMVAVRHESYELTVVELETLFDISLR